ncbi:uncharacterized protein LOC121651524 [Melanotaenia boesemani]|uniref:uncharacterized protein LOC121651524 n=1 Tax=Melanotaenia boesemani TaxID=1250792 RepID=UPI001C0451B6|nr:uncharacterized protein LOC121651524 [Melanotaenia boesemani]XP_041859738.1 uncharacterized protein LOC121651524 [Melanotaenia boesemani]
MATPAKLRIILEENDIRKLILPLGIPDTLQELLAIIGQTFCIGGEFTVMYEDTDFGGQFFTLSSIEEVVDKGTLKIVQPQAPVILNLSTVEVTDVGHSITEQTYECSSSISSGSHDTIILSPSDESESSQPWPAKFQVPAFSYDVDLMLEAGNLAYKKDGTLLNNPRLISNVLEKLAEEIFRYTAYPTGIQVLAVVEALIEKYPCLKEPGSFDGLYGWQQRIKYKMGNYRAKLRCRQLACPELEINARKRLNSNEKGSTKGIKRPKKAEVNYLPPLPIGETVDTLEQERQDCAIRSGATQECLTPADVSVIIEGTEVLTDCKSVAKACLLLMGLIYAMNLSYPTKLRYTFEVFQKLLLKLDCLKMSPKVQALHNKLLA